MRRVRRAITWPFRMVGRSARAVTNFIFDVIDAIT